MRNGLTYRNTSPKAHRTVRYRSLAFLGYPGYRVGDDGSVWTCKVRIGRKYIKTKNWTRMKTSPSKYGGYIRVSLWNEGKSYVATIHRMVLEAFVGPCPKGMQCRHLNG